MKFMIVDTVDTTVDTVLPKDLSYLANCCDPDTAQSWGFGH